MQIIVVSDTHGLKRPLDYLLDKYPEADVFVHCGDICLPPEEYPRFLTVAGNNDYYDYPYEKIIRVKNHRMLVLHSHLFGYLKREERMLKRADECDCDIICYGHTHVADNRIVDGKYLLNPGSFYHSRDGRPPSYAIINLDDDEVNIEVQFVAS